MPRALILLRPAACLLAGLLLTACATQAPMKVVRYPDPVTPIQSSVKTWLEWQDAVKAMAEPQITEGLRDMPKPTSPDQTFYYGLLNQQAQGYNSWVLARDIFRELREDESLTPEQRQLIGILEQYNQSRINGYHNRELLRAQCDALQQQLGELQEENTLLEQKIQAITDLEATISTRKEE